MNVILCFVIFLLFGLRPFIYKPIAKKYPPAIAMITDGLASLVVGIPMLISSKETFVWHPILLLCIISGACLSYQVKFSQMVLKESTSAHQYTLIIALGFGIIINKLYGELVSTGQMITVIFIAIVAILFFIRIVNHLSNKAKLAWLVNLLFTIIVITMPTLLLNYTNWFSVFLMNGIVNFATDIYEFSKCKSELKANNLKLSYGLVFVGLFHAFGELAFMYANPIIGVTTVLILKRATIPFVMVINNFIINKHEDKDADNIIFASLAGILAIMYFLTSK